MSSKHGWLGAFIIVLVLVGFVAGCQRGAKETETAKQKPAEQAEQPAEEAPAPESAAAPAAADPVAEAKDIFESRCATCHGQDGRGEGPGSKLLTPKPQNFHDRKWQASVTDETIGKAIVYGGAAVGKSPLMASNPDLQSKPKVVDALIAHVRTLGKEK